MSAAQAVRLPPLNDARSIARGTAGIRTIRSRSASDFRKPGAAGLRFPDVCPFELEPAPAWAIAQRPSPGSRTATFIPKKFQSLSPEGGSQGEAYASQQTGRPPGETASGPDIANVHQPPATFAEDSQVDLRGLIRPEA